MFFLCADQARTSIDDGPLYYTAKKRHILQCHATGFPLPHVWWQFTACFSDRPCLTAVNVSEVSEVSYYMFQWLLIISLAYVMLFDKV